MLCIDNLDGRGLHGSFDRSEEMAGRIARKMV
jgi:hypothetical protein